MSVGKLIRPGLALQGMQATGNVTVTGNIMPGRTLEGIILKLTGTGADIQDDISLFRLKANGKTIWEGTGTQLTNISDYKSGLADDATYLHIDFTEARTGRDYLDQMIGAFDTSVGVANITAEITIGAITSGGAIDWYLIESEPQRDKNLPYAGLMSKLLRYTASASAQGSFTVPLPFGPVNGGVIKRIHIESSVVTGVVVKQDGVVVHETKAVLDNSIINSVYGRTNQSGLYTVDFMPDGNVKNALDTRDARSLELTPTYNNPGTATILVEYLDVLGNL
jgi:hypothetical protein